MSEQPADRIGYSVTEPRFAWATHELALVARDLRDNRAAGDPAMVEAGKLTQAQADDRLRVADALAAEWSAYDEDRAPPAREVSDAEKVAMLTRSLAVSQQRRDQAHAAMVHEGEWMGPLERGALWQLVDAHWPQSNRMEAYLHWESYAAAIEALLWWQRRRMADGKCLVREARAAAAAATEQVRAAA